MNPDFSQVALNMDSKEKPIGHIPVYYPLMGEVFYPIYEKDRHKFSCFNHKANRHVPQKKDCMAVQDFTEEDQRKCLL